MRSFYVYIMASKLYGTLYVGSTSELVKRVWDTSVKLIQIVLQLSIAVKNFLKRGHASGK